MSLMELDFWTDYTAWAVALIFYMIYMIMVWGTSSMGGSEYNPVHRILITVFSLPACYLTAKLMIERGR